MRSKILTFISFLLVVQPGSVVAQAEYLTWDDGVGHANWTVAIGPNDTRSMIALWDSIGEDLQTETNPLAGTYFKGGYNNGYLLRWSTKKGFVLVPYFDQNLITDYSYGSVTFVDPSKIVFQPKRDLMGYRSMAKTPREWTAIWDYLVPVESVKEFGQFHAGLGVYNEFNGLCCEFRPDFLCQKVESEVKRPWYPVPSRFAYFIQRPVEGTLTFVGKKRTVKDWSYQGKLFGEWFETAVVIPVRIDFRGDPRIKKKMLLRLMGEPGYYQHIEIIRVGKRTSLGYVVRDISFGGKETYRDSPGGEEKPLPPIRVGARVTTKPRE